MYTCTCLSVCIGCDNRVVNRPSTFIHCSCVYEDPSIISHSLLTLIIIICLTFVMQCEPKIKEPVVKIKESKKSATE